MEFKGTKGKWEVEDNGKSVYSKDRNKNIAFDGQICRLHTGLNTYDNNEANAKLIACAPEMLEMVKEINEALVWYHENCTPLQRTRNNDEIFFNLGMNLRQQSEKLIKKATT